MGDEISRSRRALGVAALTAALIATAACSRVSQSTTTSGAGTTIPGTLRYADIEEPISMNPLLRLAAVGTDMDMFIFGFFFNLDDKMQFVPELATVVPSYQNGGISKDGLTITYHLRHGVRWHDGVPFSARDVIFTVHAILNPANNLESRNGWDRIASVDASDPYTVRFHLKKIYAPALTTYFCESGLYPVLPAHLLEQYADLNHVPFNTDPIGTGPFKFVKWVHGDRVELAANPDYWRGPPKLNRIIYKIIPSDTTILTQLRTHEIDAWFRAPVGLYPQLQGLTKTGYRVSLAKSLVFSHVDLNQKNPIFQDLRVRQALAHAIDRQRIVHDVTYDVHIAAYADQPSFSWAYEPDVVHYDYDPAKAAQLLDAAGWKMGPDVFREKNGQRLAFNISAAAGGKTGEAVEVILQEDFRRVGIDASIKNYPTALYFDSYANGGILQAGKYDAGLYSWVAGVDPEHEALYTSYNIPPAGENDLWWRDPVIDAA
ncbi:MAG: peptide ABC transporter substrate-binding protein, partial [Candidatus Eremiobacteraeota bacterium]|nr:peptide ABC transporter substrate-binding protein [Candidatus Eremiobacteraeota bacterium]